MKLTLAKVYYKNHTSNCSPIDDSVYCGIPNREETIPGRNEIRW